MLPLPDSSHHPTHPGHLEPLRSACLIGLALIATDPVVLASVVASSPSPGRGSFRRGPVEPLLRCAGWTLRRWTGCDPPQALAENANGTRTPKDGRQSPAHRDPTQRQSSPTPKARDTPPNHGAKPANTQHEEVVGTRKPWTAKPLLGRRCLGIVSSRPAVVRVRECATSPSLPA